MKMVRIHAASDAQDLSIWKILGAIAVLAPKFAREREETTCYTGSGLGWMNGGNVF